ncbi:MAG: hypothetical protein KatS3mg014_0447 [Actinomycetota bacterium]|nr:MAG: hypothetical protein KatS3mg014_0447 [Actinomycetota bacterium]
MGARSKRPLGRRYLALTAALLALAASCTPGPSGASSTPTTTAPPPAGSTSPRPSAEPLPEPLGPLAGLTWPAGSVPEDVLLHDDGRRLWAVPLEGEPELLWEHPAAHVYEIAAGPGGRELAYSVELPVRRARDPSYVLYLLRRDGKIETVDVVDDFVVYRGTAIDWGYAEAPWPLLPGGPDRVLVLLARDVRRVRAEKADGAFWYAVDVDTGRFTRTDAWWTPAGAPPRLVDVRPAPLAPRAADDEPGLLRPHLDLAVASLSRRAPTSGGRPRVRDPTGRSWRWGARGCRSRRGP